MVDKLGGFQFSRTVEDNTTHVVCGATRRTVNVLAGTAKGCWILSVDWVSITCTLELLIHFEAWAKLAQQWLVCVPLGIHLEPVNRELMLLVTI